MKLYQVPRNTYIKSVSSGNIVLLATLDGAYSVCTNPYGITHWSASTEVEIVNKQEYDSYWDSYEFF